MHQKHRYVSGERIWVGHPKALYRYCQMIQDVNKETRLNFAKDNKDMTLQDTIYTDETTVQIEAHRRTCSSKRGCKPRYKPKPKHPVRSMSGEVSAIVVEQVCASSKEK